MIDQKLAVCVIGMGRAGMIHAQNFRRNVPGAMLAAIVEPVEKTAREAMAQLNLSVWYRDYRDALADEKIDAYVVVSPTEFHAKTVIGIARCKKHILCEKPMAMTEEECDRMIEAADENGISLQIGFMRRFDESYRQAKEMIDAGDIGEVVMVRSNTRGPSVPRPWMYDLGKSNGPLAEVNSHDIDIMRWFTGSEFQTVYAVGGNYRCPDFREKFPDFYDNVVMAASFRNGMQGILDGAQGVGYAYDARAEIVGTKGYISLGGLQDGRVICCSSTGKNGTYPLVKSWRNLFEEAYIREDRAFAECILKGERPAVTGIDGKMAVKVVNAGNRSIREQRMVNLQEEKNL